MNDSVEVRVGAWLAIGLLIISGLILILNHDVGSIAGMEASVFAGLVASVALLIWLGGGLFASYAGRLGKALRDIVIWAGFALILVTIYTFRFEILDAGQRVAEQLLPAGSHISISPYEGKKAAVRIRRRDDGHFVARTHINGAPLSMIVDTGASTIVLKPDDARQIGVNLSGLRYTVVVQTANGTTFAAPIRLDKVTIGPVGVNGVDALIAKPGALNQSLLGMSFLSRLRSYEFSGDFLTLRS